MRPDELSNESQATLTDTVGAELMEVWRERDIDSQALVPDARGSLRPVDTAMAHETVAAWNNQAAADNEHAPTGIELGQVLGEGGMGIVHAATQLALRRSVAVKEVRPVAASPSAIAGLLREAWVSGNLEHPNIVPVHALMPGTHSPRIVMKRIEGTAWSELLDRRKSPEDDLDHHLGVLGQVCRAVHFAHSRGVLHLDLKPANVMLGRFGEVYLVDWGIAAGLDATGPEWLPKASAIDCVIGTPRYLAPELAAGEGARIGVTTDVYELGAILHEILTGGPRHSGINVPEMLISAFISLPINYPPNVPRELAAIANRATSRLNGDRFPDAESLRLALESYASHRSATRLSDDALTRLERIAQLVTQVAKGTMRSRTPDGDALLERLFIECRFAFEQALAIWPDSQEAKAGKRRLLEVMIDDAIAGQQVRQATAYLAELESPSPERVAAVAKLRTDMAAREAARRALERYGHETDVNFNLGSRSLLAAITGALWIVWNSVAAWAFKGPLAPLSYDVLIGSVGATLVMYAASLYVFRRTLLTTAVNRRILGLFGAWFVMVLLSFVGAWLAGTDATAAVTATYKIYLAYCLALTAFVDWRCIITCVLIAPFTVFGPSHPEYAFEMVSVIGGLVGFSLAIIWRRPMRSKYLPETT